MKKFPIFWYESNACWGYVKSIEDLTEKCKIWMEHGNMSKNDFLDFSRQVQNPNTANYGTRIEHNGKKTLREFLEENEINF